MASYIKATDFSAKDNLLTGDPLKIVSGTEIDNEFNAIQTAVNTKANTNSPGLTGTPTAPTATAGTSTVQIATTAFVTTALTSYETVVDAAIATAVAETKQALYPVGSIYTNSTNSTNPATLLGFGTWVRFGKGRVLVSQDSANTLFDTAEETGGSYDAVNVAHTHSITDPGHRHTIPNAQNNDGGQPYVEDAGGYNLLTTYTNTVTTGITINSAGESGTNKNIQPYITVYMWKRVS